MNSGNGQWTSDSAAYLLPQSGDSTDAWAQEAAAQGAVGTQLLLAVGLDTPPPAVRDLLRLEDGHEAVCRRRLILRDDTPVELADSWYPAKIATGTELAQARKIKGGAPTLLAQLGHTITDVVEYVASRLADDAEQEHLHLGPHDPVLVLTRLNRNQHGEPIEASVMVTPGSECRLRYDMKVN